VALPESTNTKPPYLAGSRSFLSRHWHTCAIAVIAIICILAVIERDRVRAHWWAWRLAQTTDIRQRDYLLACLTSVGEASAGALNNLAGNSDASLRLIAVFGLCKIPPALAIPGLSSLLSDQAIEVRLQAATSLAFFDTPAAIETLYRAAKSESADEAGAAVAGLARVPAPLALPALCDASRTSKSPYVRAQTIESMGELLTSEDGQPSPGCDPLMQLIECLSDQGKFDGYLALELEVSKATKAASKSAPTSLKGPATSDTPPSDRTVRQIAATILQQATGVPIRADANRTESERAELATRCRAALRQRATPLKPPSSSPTTTQSR
jgi:hypothetical protein